MKALLPVIFAVVGIAIGAGAGLFLAPKPEEACEKPPCEEASKEKPEKEEESDAEDEADYLRLQSQFVVPIIREERVSSLVVMSISLEVQPNSEDYIYEREPKLRDVLLQVLFDHAFIGGFEGKFTESSRLTSLRVALLEGAKSVLGDRVTDILITDIMRQEI